MNRTALFAGKTGYQVLEFSAAAEALGIDLVLATDRCHVLDDPWRDRAVAIREDHLDASAWELAARGPFSGILAVGDHPACLAAQVAERLGLRFHPQTAVLAATNKLLTRERFRAAGLLSPDFGLLEVRPHRFPCVLKPLHSSASRGVIRANNENEFQAAVERIGRIERMPGGGAAILVEDFIPGKEFALEAIVTEGRLQVLAIFDKPDPLDGPFFEETIYVTPSKASGQVQDAIRRTAQQAAEALGLTHGPIHAEMRVNDQGVWMLEVAPRPIGGLCSRVLRFGEHSFETLLLEHAIGAGVSGYRLSPGAHGVMMMPVERAGVFESVQGLDQARAVPGIEDIVITAKEGQELVPWPEGNSYPGFLFSRAHSADGVVRALRSAYGRLEFVVRAALPVVK